MSKVDTSKENGENASLEGGNVNRVYGTDNS